MTASGPLPPASGLARSLRRLFDETGGGAGGTDGDDGERTANGASPTPEREPERVREPGREPERGVALAARERFTNRFARYLRADRAARAELREAIRSDVALFLEAGEPGPLADAVLALGSWDGIDAEPPFRNGVEAVDPLLPLLLAPEVLAELSRRRAPARRSP